jgi:hypothetical protein
MIPENRITAAPIVGNFSFPLTEEYNPIHQRVFGGISLGDSTKGRLFKLWEVKLNNGIISIGPVGSSIVLNIQAPGASSVGLAFDTAMRVTVCWTTTTGSWLFYYNTVTQNYSTLFFQGYTSCRVCVDDPRSFYETESDVIFSYTYSGNLYWRQQRDRYSEERHIGPTPGSIIKVGLSLLGRLQFEILGGELQPIPDDLGSLKYNLQVTRLNGFTPVQ